MARRTLTRALVSGAMAAAALPGLVIGCSSSSQEIVEGEAPLSRAECDLLNPDFSLVIHDAQTFAAADFSLKRTLNAIIATSGGTATTPELLLKSLLEDFALDKATQPESGLVLPVDPRAEANLNPSIVINDDPLHPGNAKHMRPIALFNRLDLAPHDGSHCGEYRIVYAKTSSATGRMFLIFEAALPNPNPSQGIAGCKPIADFWASLSGPMSISERATKLAEFYYTGLPGIEPVVTHSHYGLPFGQVRSNHFLNMVKWQLREWRTSFDTSLAPTFQMDTVKQVPLAQFYNSSFMPGPTGEFANTDPALFATERAAFQADFLNHQISELARPEVSGGPLTAALIINGIGSAFPNRFNEFQSDAQDGQDVPLTHAANGFAAQISAAAPSGLTAEHLLHRAAANSCGGCHRFSDNMPIGTLNGNVVKWPSSNIFTHVDENRILSPALKNFFLPARMAVLTDFVCARKFCCFEDSDCSNATHCATERDNLHGEGVCKPSLPAGQCWEDSDCGPSGDCQGAIVCPCGTACSRPDQPGSCSSSSLLAVTPSEEAPNRIEPSPTANSDVNRARLALLSDAASGQADSGRMEQLEQAVRAARAAEQQQPGAFVQRRFVH